MRWWLERLGVSRGLGIVELLKRGIESVKVLGDLQ